jgi:Mg2+-importing ATPase
VRKKLSIIIGTLGETRIICKGAFDQVIKVCTGTTQQFDTETRQKLQVLFDAWSQQGFRVLAVASGPVIPKANYTSDDERDLQFLGFLVFADRPKAGIDQTVSSLKELGVGIKIITGDNAAVSKHVAESIGIQNPAVLTSSELNLLSDEALWNRVSKVDIFAHVDPSQKARIILALKHTGHVVGYMGDGINDIAAMHAADASISVESAVDIAKVTADFVFIEKNLDMSKADRLLPIP